jgi:hypothetical protein
MAMHSFTNENCQASHRHQPSTLTSEKSFSLLFSPFLEQKKNPSVKSMASFNQGLGEEKKIQ